MKNVVLFKKIAILAFFTLFSGISHLQSMESATTIAATPSFHTLLTTNLSRALTTFTAIQTNSATPREEREKLAATVETINTTLHAWRNLSDFIEANLFDAIFAHMGNMYQIFTKNKMGGPETLATDPKQVLKNNLAFAQFVRQNWDAFIRACEFIGVAHFTPEKMFLLLETINTYAPFTTTPALAQYNEPGNQKLTIASLDGEMLVLLTKCYEYFLTTISKTYAEFGITTLLELQTAFTQAKPLVFNATSMQKQKRQVALGDLFTTVLNQCTNAGLFSVYEDNTISANVDAAATVLGSKDVPKKLRMAKRKATDPSHRIFETIVAFIPLVLMSTMNTLLAQHCGDNGAFTIMLLNMCTMLTAMLWGNGKLVTALSCLNPMRLAPLMWLIRSAGHKTIDCLVAKSGSKSFMNPIAWIGKIGQGTYQTYVIGKFIIPIIYGMLYGIVSTGTGIAGNAYGIAADMLMTLPSLLFGNRTVTA